MKHSPRFLKLVADKKKHIKEISRPEVLEKIQSKTRFVLIDVREDGEWAKDHLVSAIHLGKGIIERDIETTVPNPNENIVLYCGGGYRSALAANALREMGYTNVWSMEGGYRGWVDDGLPLTHEK